MSAGGAPGAGAAHFGEPLKLAELARRYPGRIELPRLAVLGYAVGGALPVCAEIDESFNLDPDDIERTLRTVAAMQQLDCFKNQFGPDVVSRLEKPLAAAHAALDEARTRASNDPQKAR